MIEKAIIFFGQRVVHRCDGRCSKAWGRNQRPTEQYDADDPDDFAYLADDELGDAPVDPGTYEGGFAKPLVVRGSEDVNRWCIRECERATMTVPGEKPLLKDFSRRVYNLHSRQLRVVD